MDKKRGQIWVETVVYTLIGLSIIALVIGVMTPRIKQMNDRATIEQTMTSLISLNEKIKATQIGVGNRRIADIRIRKGELIIDSGNDVVYYILKESNLRFSEPNVSISEGSINILTEEEAGKYNINLILDYSGSLNITYEDRDRRQVFTQAPVAYEIAIENKGGDSNQLDISSVS